MWAIDETLLHIVSVADTVVDTNQLEQRYIDSFSIQSDDIVVEEFVTCTFLLHLKDNEVYIY